MYIVFIFRTRLNLQKPQHTQSMHTKCQKDSFRLFWITQTPNVYVHEMLNASALCWVWHCLGDDNNLTKMWIKAVYHASLLHILHTKKKIHLFILCILYKSADTSDYASKYDECEMWPFDSNYIRYVTNILFCTIRQIRHSNSIFACACVCMRVRACACICV